MKPSPALVLAFVAALLTVLFVYVLQRAYGAMFTLEANPALIIASERVAMFERIAVGAYLGALIAPLVFVLARRDAPRVLRALAIATPVVALLLVAQSAVFP